MMETTYMHRVLIGIISVLLPAASTFGDEIGWSEQMNKIAHGDRTLCHETVIPASLEEVWQAWTTTEGIQSFFTPNANVELKVGGKYELFFDMSAEPGMRGAEDCHVLSYLPMEMLSYEWNAPPSIPILREAGVKTWVVMQFEDLGDNRVRIKHTMLGIGEGEDWDSYIAYFERAWTHVLDACKQRFEKEAADGE